MIILALDALDLNLARKSQCKNLMQKELGKADISDFKLELEDLSEQVRGSNDFIIIISDHGMKALGRYGDHTKNGFYSSNRILNLTSENNGILRINKEYQK